MKISSEATIILDHDDIADILTETLCSYSVFSDLRVEGVSQNGDCNFVVNLVPNTQQATIKAVA